MKPKPKGKNPSLEEFPPWMWHLKVGSEKSYTCKFRYVKKGIYLEINVGYLYLYNR